MKYVLSSTKFDKISKAEKVVKGWLSTNQFNHHTKLYKVTEVYYPVIKFVKGKL